MAYANWFACSTGSEHITEDHIFAGILIQNEGVALEVLRQLDISIEQIRQWHELTHIKSEYKEPQVRLPTTVAAQELIAHALQFCRANRHNGVGTEHLLIGWLSIQSEAADVFLKKTGLTIEAVRIKVLEVLAGQRDLEPGFFRRLLQGLISSLRAS